MEHPTVNDAHKVTVGAVNPPERLLCGPGPCNTDPRVLDAVCKPALGYSDPAYLALMDETQELLRYSLQTSNAITLPITSSGSGAMEACVMQLVEPGDVVVIASAGYFAERMATMAERHGGVVHVIRRPWGTAFTLEEITAAVEQHKPAVLGVVNAETSTGVLQPLTGLGDLCRRNGALLLADCVTSHGGAPLFIDEWGVDACYAGAQKCISAIPGMACLSLSERAMAKIQGRKTPVDSWYLDVQLIAKYWNPDVRAYHHTGPIQMTYGFREALRVVSEEGLEARWRRHADAAAFLYTQLQQELGLELLVDEGARLPPLTTVKVPDGVDAKAVTAHMLSQHQVEIGNGLGELSGKVWRIGLMGVNANRDVVVRLISALRDSLTQNGYVI